MSETAPQPENVRLSGTAIAFEDAPSGSFIDIGETVVSTAMIDAFAALTGDRFAIHMEDAAARALGFPKRVAHGLLILSLVDGLKNQAEARFSAVASLGWTWRFERPVLAGDRISARMTVTGRRETKRLDRAILALAFAVRNQHGELVQTGENNLMVHRRGAAAVS